MIFLSTPFNDPFHVPRDICRSGMPLSFDQTPCATQSLISSSSSISDASAFRLCVTETSLRSISTDIRWKRLRTFCLVTARRPSAGDNRSNENVIRFISCSMHEKIVMIRPISRRRSAGNLCAALTQQAGGRVGQSLVQQDLDHAASSAIMRSSRLHAAKSKAWRTSSASSSGNS